MNPPAPPLDPATTIVLENALAEDRLRWLSLGYYVSGSITVLLSIFFLIYAAFFVALSFVPEEHWDKKSDRPSEEAAVAPLVANDKPIGTPSPAAPVESRSSNPSPIWLFRLIGGIVFGFVLLSWGFAALTLYTGSCLRKGKHKVFIQVMAILKCLLMPYGTLLGVLTLLALETPGARRLFNPPVN
jgi:hypothetical protein